MSINRPGGNGERVHVLLAAYRGARYLPEQVASILDQHDVTLKLHISVDRCDDGTLEWCEALIEENPHIDLLPYGRRHGSAALNFYYLLREVDLSDASYVAFADQDDFWLPEKLSRAQEKLAETGCDGYSSNVYAWRGENSRKLLRKVGQQRRWDHLFSSPGPGCTHVLSGKSARRLQELVTSQAEVVRQVEYHDWLDYALVRSEGGRWFMDSMPTMLYRQHDSNQLGANLGWRAAASRWGRLNDGWYWDQVRQISRLVGAESELPVRLLSDNTLRSRMLIATMAPRLRRDFKGIFGLAASALARGFA